MTLVTKFSTSKNWLEISHTLDPQELQLAAGARFH
jgi:hypothetical protein